MPAKFRRVRISIASAFITLILSGSPFAMPASLCVDPSNSGGCFTTIQAAIDHTGKAGSVVTISAGNYFEDLTIGKIKIDFEGESGTELFLGKGITIAAGAHVTLNRMDVQEGLSSCFTSSGSLTIMNSNVFLCSGMRGGAIHQVGGKLTILRSEIDGNSATENGGCIAMEGGKLSLVGVDFAGCFAVGDGGALWLSNTNANVNGTTSSAHQPGSQISNSKANGSGGAILTIGGKVAIEAAQIDDNSAKGDGGAIRSSSALTIADTVIIGNSADGSGGGILAQGGGKLTLTDSSIASNKAKAGVGGGIAADAPFNLLNVTVVDNQATQGGGGISAGANGKISSLTIDGNSASGDGGGIDVTTGIVKITNTIMALNSAPMEFAQDCGGSFKSQGFNLIFDTTFCSISGESVSDIIGDDPALAAPEHFDVKIVQEPNPGSPVLGAGGHCPKTDEVFHTRPKKACDIGAFESP